MKISIITVSYNSLKTIEETIISVLGQDYANLEYIIVDGESTDGTLDVVRKYQDKIDIIVSEKDSGLYDALNKGIALATGDAVGILHSDDVFDSPFVVSQVVEGYRKSNADVVYGNLLYVDRYCLGRVVRNWIAGPYKKQAFEKGWMPPHPTFFARKACFEQFGNYNTNFKTAADYELMLRFVEKHQVKCHYVDETLVRMRIGGTSNATLKNRVRANNEDTMAWEVNGLAPQPYTRYLKPLRKLNQFSLDFYGHKFLLPVLILAGLFLGSVLTLNYRYVDLPLKVVMSGFLSWGIAMLALPAIVDIARIKNLTDRPNHRSSHSNATPTLGGIAVFAATLFATNLLIEGFLTEFKIITAAVLVIFFSGVKDDIFALAAKKKLVAQVIASMLIVLAADLKIDSLYGILEVFELNTFWSLSITVLSIIVITNAFNLTDGIDGLASGLGIISAISFGTWFTYHGHYDYGIFSFTLAGSLAAFVKFNFSKIQKIFLGDTGSLVVGFSLAVLAIKFIAISSHMSTDGIPNAPLLAFCILILPLFDLLRVFLTRVFNNKSPFAADKTHIHHLLINRNPSHLRASIILVAANGLVILSAFLMFQHLEAYYFMLLLVVLFMSYYFICRHLEKSPKGVYKVFIAKKAPFIAKLIWNKSYVD